MQGIITAYFESGVPQANELGIGLICAIQKTLEDVFSATDKEKTDDSLIGFINTLLKCVDDKIMNQTDEEIKFQVQSTSNKMIALYKSLYKLSDHDLDKD